MPNYTAHCKYEHSKRLITFKRISNKKAIITSPNQPKKELNKFKTKGIIFYDNLFFVMMHKVNACINLRTRKALDQKQTEKLY